MDFIICKSTAHGKYFHDSLTCNENAFNRLKSIRS